MNEFYQSLWALPPNTICCMDNHEYVFVENTQHLLEPEYILSFMRKATSGRINFIAAKFDDVLYKMLAPAETYAWYLLGKKNNMVIEKKLNKPSFFSIKQYKKIPVRIKEFLIHEWEVSYFNQIHAHASESQKNKLHSNFIVTLNEGCHFIYRDSINNQILAHASYVDDLNEALNLSNAYIHFWVNQHYSSSIRSQLLTSIFDTFDKQVLPQIAGVAVNNYKSLKVLQKANFTPLTLSVRGDF